MSEDAARGETLPADLTLAQGVAAEGFPARTGLEEAAHAVADLEGRLADAVDRLLGRGDQSKPKWREMLASVAAAKSLYVLTSAVTAYRNGVSFVEAKLR